MTKQFRSWSDLVRGQTVARGSRSCSWVCWHYILLLGACAQFFSGDLGNFSNLFFWKITWKNYVPKFRAVSGILPWIFEGDNLLECVLSSWIAHSSTSIFKRPSWSSVWHVHLVHWHLAFLISRVWNNDSTQYVTVESIFDSEEDKILERIRV